MLLSLIGTYRRQAVLTSGDVVLENRSESSSTSIFVCVRAAMIHASLRTNGLCVEIMEFNGSINGGIYL